MGSSQTRVTFEVPKIVRHPYKKGPQKGTLSWRKLPATQELSLEKRYLALPCLPKARQVAEPTAVQSSGFVGPILAV